MKANRRKQRCIPVIAILIVLIALVIFAVLAAVCLLHNDGNTDTPDVGNHPTTNATTEAATDVPTDTGETHEQTEVPTTHPVVEDDRQGTYDQMLQMIDEGDCTGIAMLLLESENAQTLYDYMQSEDTDLMHYIIVDAMVQLAKQGKIENLVQLRLRGFVTDACFEDYWEVMGSEMPVESAQDPDLYLVHELLMAYRRDTYAVRSLKEMRNAGVIDNDMHAALVKALGFDYTDSQYMQDNGIAPLQGLTAEEKATYEAVLEYIDQGDCCSIAEDMLYGEITAAVYEYLMEEDSELMEFVIAQAMAMYEEECNLQNVVRLRLEGFVSDGCFQTYWEIAGFTAPEGESASDAYPGVDMYLLHELEQISERYGDDGQMLRDLWYSGLISDSLQELLVDRLGYDYTQSA